ncbi:hypothetical protein SOP94_17155 [Peribacillus frigoritolerans]|uniref:hypothetical protein n=1 Tax=Peribacillus frigoritolerans TaxID=450367 RepID=UPI002B246997|nr:hypothetical protein [Peribacillus frigoritolerans]MEB2630186.1 hypothetical protein [Peribacillus frigoritolerans]
MDFQTIVTTIITSGLVSSAITVGIHTFLKGRINHHFSKKIEEFKEQITIQAENRKADFDRKIHDFSLYSTKKHEIYPDLYSQSYTLWHDLQIFQNILDYLKAIVNPNHFPHFDSHSADPDPEKDYEVIINLLEQSAFFLDEETKSILMDEIQDFNGLDTNKHVENISKIISEGVLIQLNQKIKDLKHFHMSNLLYIPDDVSVRMYRLTNGFRVYIAYILSNYDSSYEIEIPDEDTVLSLSDLIEILNEVKVLLKQELAIGYYSR